MPLSSLALTSTNAFVPETTIRPCFKPLNVSPLKIAPIKPSSEATATRPNYLNDTPNQSYNVDLPYQQDSGKNTFTNTNEDTSILVQGGSLRTWSYRSPLVEKVQVLISSEGRPFDADLELWHGPDNTPNKMRIYVENG